VCITPVWVTIIIVLPGEMNNNYYELLVSFEIESWGVFLGQWQFLGGTEINYCFVCMISV